MNAVRPEKAGLCVLATAVFSGSTVVALKPPLFLLFAARFCLQPRNAIFLAHVFTCIYGLFVLSIVICSCWRLRSSFPDIPRRHAANLALKDTILFFWRCSLCAAAVGMAIAATVLSAGPPARITLFLIAAVTYLSCAVVWTIFYLPKGLLELACALLPEAEHLSWTDEWWREMDACISWTNKVRFSASLVVAAWGIRHNGPAPELGRVPAVVLLATTVRDPSAHLP